MTTGQSAADDVLVGPPSLGIAHSDVAASLTGAELALYEVQRLKRDAQDGRPITSEEVEARIGAADEAGYPEVARAAMALDIVRRFVETGVWPDAVCVERLMERAVADGAPSGIALALALRGQLDPDDPERGSIGGPDDDLTRASVLLEGSATRSVEAAAAHIECARAYAYRGLWEMELDHYQAADAASQGCPGASFVRPTILYNTAETQLNWCASLRERGPDALIPKRVAVARAALKRADVDVLPESWRGELRIFGVLLDAIAAPHSTAEIVIADPDEPYVGYLHLARALTATELDVARAAVTTAVEKIDPDLSGDVHLLALCIATELEAAARGGDSAGLEWARVLVEKRWQTRLATLAVMRSRRDVERLRSEHAILDRDAHLDELTGLANRRALRRYADSLQARGVEHAALALLDLDGFKKVNDQHGHLAGDEVLRQVGRILRTSVRDGDIAVRLGGDEFLIVLALENVTAARRRCDEIITAVASVDWDRVSEGLKVSASMGVAAGRPADLQELSTRADAELYRCKALGGNRAAG